MNVSAMIKRLKGKHYTVFRNNSNGSYSDTTGEFVEGTQTSFSLFASVQPLSAREEISIPEGDRTRMRMRVFSLTPMLTINNTNLRIGDRIRIEGELFQVESVAQWGAYSKAIVVTVNTNEN